MQLLALLLFGILKIKMKKIKKFILIVFSITFASQVIAKEVPNSFADLAEKLMPSVVNISTTTTVVTNSNPFPGFQFPPGSPFEDMFKEFGTPQTRKSAALGSGFIIEKSGIVVTNNHVIQDAEDILVRVDGDKEYKATVIGADPLSDIAVLQIESKEKFIPVKFGDSDKARIGDWVIAIGNPFGLGGTVTAGIISARNRSIGLSRYEDYIQTDASINSGNSGGPLFDMNGDVIGINTAILGKGGSIGIGFSIPSNSAKKVIDQLIEFGETKRGWLGVRIQVVTQEIADIEKLDALKAEIHFYGYYKKWVPQENYYYCVENTGFEANPVRNEATYSKYASLDDKIDGFHYYLALIKFGLGRCTSDTAHEIRDGHILREEGVALVNKFDSEFPVKYFKTFLEYCGITEEYFTEQVDSWRSPHLWGKDQDGNWKLKHNVAGTGLED